MATKKQTTNTDIKSAVLVPVLSPDKTTCTIGDLTLIINNTIDYMPTGELRESVGKIDSFRYPGLGQTDTGSVWMRVVDVLTKEIKTENISVSVWYETFGKPKNETKNVSKKQDNTQKSPF